MTITPPVNNKPIKFEINTGAQVTVISSKAHQEIGGPTLSALSKTLRDPSNSKLAARGQFTVTLRHKGQVIEQEVYVVDSLHKPLLGQLANEKLKLVM